MVHCLWVGDIFKDVPAPSHGHRQDYYIFSKGSFKEILHLPVLLGGSSHPKLHDTANNGLTEIPIIKVVVYHPWSFDSLCHWKMMSYTSLLWDPQFLFGLRKNPKNGSLRHRIEVTPFDGFGQFAGVAGIGSMGLVVYTYTFGGFFMVKSYVTIPVLWSSCCCC